MPRKNRAYKKGAPHRDARLFLIVAEGEREDVYFRYFHEQNQRIQIEIVPRLPGKSAPNFFLDRVHDFEASGKWQKKQSDILWFVLDVDRWQRSEIDAIQLACEQEDNWHTGISNPCFEVWLHFHLGPVPDSDENCADLKKALPKKINGGFNVHTFCPKIETAARNAREADAAPQHFFPDRMQSKLYLLANQITLIIRNFNQ